MSKKCSPVHLLGLLCILGHLAVVGRSCGYTSARFYKVRYYQSNDESQGSYQFKIKQGFSTNPSQFFQVSGACNTRNDGEKNDGGNHHADHVDEGLADQLCRIGYTWIFDPDKDTQK